MPFVDTNVLFYAYDVSSWQKHVIARSILDQATANRSLVLSVQVMNEFYWQAIRPRPKPLMTAQEAQLRLGQIAKVSTIVSLDWAMSREAMQLSHEHSISFWDALIVVAAQRSGCEVLLSEDMQHGRVINGITIQNPFL